jgi:hypothetical protein
LTSGLPPEAEAIIRPNIQPDMKVKVSSYTTKSTWELAQTGNKDSSRKAGKKAERQTDRKGKREGQAGRQAGRNRQADREAGRNRQAYREADKVTDS